ncbi:DNA cytosine methyltransferase [Brevundimonas sp.]|uniref:DNA cytosine methyltransferase n=1 Tax=Brevundimonas sp. TaxID=1871086 RepID=UPI003BAD9BEE
MRFIDLFAGLGGFHVALSRLGHKCVFASEIDPQLRGLYERNFGLKAAGDIREIDLAQVPEFDVLCAGFPCQPFSKAGRQEGFDCDQNGDLAGLIIHWLRRRRPPFFILENVPNFLKHDQERSWRWLSRELRHAGYTIDARVLSADELGFPQIRERLFIVGARSGLETFNWPAQVQNRPVLRDFLECHPPEARRVSPQVDAALDVWQSFLDAYPKDRRKPWFPIWAAEFGATYPFATTGPLGVPSEALRTYTGAFGQSLASSDDAVLADRLPPYARSAKAFPDWKIKFIQSNRDLYEQNRDWIDPWMPRLRPFEHSLQKFEWNFEGRSLEDAVIQLRGSGVRAKAAESAPTLVAASSSQVPIIGWERRYLTIRERARLQDLGELTGLPASHDAANRALGNAVNAGVAEQVALNLLSTAWLQSSRQSAVL